jgi:hypothetical protein
MKRHSKGVNEAKYIKTTEEDFKILFKEFLPTKNRFYE